jgi:hypothetical protein
MGDDAVLPVELKWGEGRGHWWSLSYCWLLTRQPGGLALGGPGSLSCDVDGWMSGADSVDGQGPRIVERFFCASRRGTSLQLKTCLNGVSSPHSAGRRQQWFLHFPLKTSLWVWVTILTCSELLVPVISGDPLLPEVFVGSVLSDTTHCCNGEPFSVHVFHP